MESLKRILILCDAHDCIRHESTDVFLLKQLYIVAFLLKTHFSPDEYLLHINNRALIDFDVFWEKECTLKDYLRNYVIHCSWDTLDLQAYDAVATMMCY